MTDEVLGTTAGNYRITSCLSVGGMGRIYRAEHVLIGRPAAIKVLQPELTTNRDIVNRFFNEARATSAIQHPGIVEIYDFGYLASGHAYIVMELLEGRTLTRKVKASGALAEGEAAMLLRGVCNALAAAHDKGIVHRDLKPDNIFLVPDPDQPLGERPKLLDFGIAKLTELGEAGNATKTGAVMGTPTYMSPEQCRGSGEVDHRADLYSIGCIFYKLVTGRPPFTNPGSGELIGAHLFVQPESPRAYCPDLSPDSEALIMALLAKDPAQRPQSARELAVHLARIAHAHGVATTSSVDALAGAPAPWPMAARSTHSTPTIAAPEGGTPASYPEVDAQALAAAAQPTTLSSAASQVVVGRPRRRRGLGIAAAAVISIAAGGIAIGVMSHGSKPGPAAAQPTPAPSAPTPARSAPTPAPVAASSTPTPARSAPTPAPVAASSTPPPANPAHATATVPTAHAIPPAHATTAVASPSPKPTTTPKHRATVAHAKDTARTSHHTATPKKSPDPTAGLPIDTSVE